MIPGLNLSNTFTNTSLGLKNSIDYLFLGDPNYIFVGVLSTLDSFSRGGILMLEIIPPLNFSRIRIQLANSQKIVVCDAKEDSV
jgi:hypothetical protein